MDIVVQILGLLQTEPLTIPEIVARVPDLSALVGGQEVARLLLRLDRRVCLLSDGRWAPVATDVTPKFQIIQSAQHYFERNAKQGEGIKTLCSAIVNETGIPEEAVRAVIVSYFRVNAGTFVLNQPKE